MCGDEDQIPNRMRRRNGWTRPYDSQQILGWSVIVLFLFLYLGILVHSLLRVGQIVAYLVFIITLLIHVTAFFISTTIDPAPENVRMLSYEEPINTFDRTKSVHVIQDKLCSLCGVHVSPKTKHCRTCNKCIEEFDHHCKWLNSCVGSRNYRIFILCIASGFIGSLIIFLTALYEIIVYYVCKTCLQPYLDHQIIIDEAKLKNETYNVDYLPVFVPVPDYVWLATVIFIIVLSIIPIILLFQLLAFHIMFYLKQMSSYDYIMKRRKEAEKKKAAAKGKETDDEFSEPQVQKCSSARIGINKIKTSIIPDEGCSTYKNRANFQYSKKFPQEEKA